MFKYIPPDLDLCVLSIHEREGYVKVALPIDGAPTGVNPYTTVLPQIEILTMHAIGCIYGHH